MVCDSDAKLPGLVGLQTDLRLCGYCVDLQEEIVHRERKGGRGGGGERERERGRQTNIDIRRHDTRTYRYGCIERFIVIDVCD